MASSINASTYTGEVAKIRAGIADRVPELLAALMSKALDGDVGAARLLLERAIAPLKAAEHPEELTLPDGSLTDRGSAVLRAMDSGAIAPDWEPRKSPPSVLGPSH